MPFRGKKEKSSMPLFAQPKKRHAAWAQALYFMAVNQNCLTS
jgi:hypothetical protein